MPTVDQAIDEFLSQKRIAVAGVSRDAGSSHASNGIYSRFKERGYEVFPVNPNADEVLGDTCYHSVKDIPGGVDGVVIATNPKASLAVAQDCKEAGVSKVWFHKNFGAGSYSSEAHDYCKENGITALVSCPLWYGQTADGFHKFFGAACRVLRQVPSELQRVTEALEPRELSTSAEPVEENFGKTLWRVDVYALPVGLFIR